MTTFNSENKFPEYKVFFFFRSRSTSISAKKLDMRFLSVSQTDCSLKCQDNCSKSLKETVNTI